jgi:hypothetical protein
VKTENLLPRSERGFITMFTEFATRDFSAVNQSAPLSSTIWENSILIGYFVYYSPNYSQVFHVVSPFRFSEKIYVKFSSLTSVLHDLPIL